MGHFPSIFVVIYLIREDTCSVINIHQLMFYIRFQSQLAFHIWSKRGKVFTYSLYYLHNTCKYIRACCFCLMQVRVSMPVLPYK